MEPKRSGSQWAWVAVAAIVAIAGVAIAFIVTNKNSSKTVAITTATQANARATPQTTAHKAARPKVVVKTVTTQTNTVVQQAALAQPSGSPSGLIACDQNISVNSATSCAFADRVFSHYAQDVQYGGGPGTYTVYAYSPATGQHYYDTCSYNPQNQLVLCSHGSDLIQFPYWAASVYHP